MRPGTTDRAVYFGLLLIVAVTPLLLFTGAANVNSIKTLVFSLAVAVMTAIWLGTGLLAGDLSWPKSRLHTAILVYLGAAFVSVLWSPFKYASFSDFLRLVSYALFYLLVVSHLRDTRRVMGLLTAAMIGAAFACAYGILQRFGIDWIEWTPKEERILSSFANPTFFAGYLVLLTPLALTMFVLPRNEKGTWPTVAWGGLALAMLLCVVWTYARAAYGGLAVGLVLAAAILPNPDPGGVTRNVWRRAVLLGAVLVILVGPRIPLRPSPYQQQRIASSFSTKDRSNVQRLMMWRGALGIFKQHPILGSGLATYQFLIPQHMSHQFYLTGNTVMVEHAHNEVAEVAAEQGIVGLAAFIGLVVCFLASVLSLVRRPAPYWQFVAVGSLAAVIAFQIQNLAAVTMHRTACVIYLWLNMALVTAGHRIAALEAGQEPRLTRWRIRVPKRISAALIGALIVGVVLTGVYGGRVFLSEIALKQGERALQEGYWPSAEMSLRRALQLNRYSLGAYYKLAHLLNIMGRFPESLATYRALERLAPDYARIHFNLGVVLSNMGRAREALTEYRKAVALEDSPANHSALAQTYLRLGEPSEAVREAAAAVKRDPSDPALASQLARIQFRMGRPNEAEATLRAALKPDSNRSEPHFALGNLYLSVKRYAEAVTEFNRAAGLSPRDPRILNNLGNAYQAQGRYREAVASYQQALALSPQDVNATFNLALAHLKLGLVAEAQSGLRRVTELAPGSEQANRAELLLQKMSRERAQPLGR